MIRSSVLFAPAYIVFSASVAVAQLATPAAVRADLASPSYETFHSSLDRPSMAYGPGAVPVDCPEPLAAVTIAHGPRTHGAVVGALWGGLAGVVLGSLVGGRCAAEGPCFVSGAVIGGAIGAVAGAVIGALVAEDTPP